MGPALRAQPDRRLVDLVRDGYDAAFEEIVRRYRRPLDRFAAAIVGGRSEDVTQDAFSKALLALRGSEAEIELRPWLYRIVRNTALNDLRDRAPVAEELSEALPGGRSAAAEAEAREELRELMERLRALPEPQRAALVMRELEGLSHEEIAAALGVTGGAARQVIYRARAALRDGLGLLVPLPVLRMLAEHGDEAAGTVAAAGASSAGGAALGGLGGGAIKAGMATFLIAGALGAGVAVEHGHSDGKGPEAAEAAPLAGGGKDRPRGSGGETGKAGDTSSASSRRHGRGSDDRGGEDHRGRDSGGGVGSLSGEGRGSSGSEPRHDGGGGSNAGPGSSGGDRHGGSGIEDSSNSGSGGSGGSGSDDGTGGGSGDSLSSGSSGDGGGSGSGSSGPGSGDSGSGSGEIGEPVPEPVETDGGGDSSSSGGDGSGSGSGSGDLGSLDGSS